MLWAAVSYKLFHYFIIAQSVSLVLAFLQITAIVLYWKRWGNCAAFKAVNYELVCECLVWPVQELGDAFADDLGKYGGTFCSAAFQNSAWQNLKCVNCVGQSQHFAKSLGAKSGSHIGHKEKILEKGIT